MSGQAIIKGARQLVTAEDFCSSPRHKSRRCALRDNRRLRSNCRLDAGAGCDLHLPSAGAATAALWIGGTLDPIHTIWVVTTTIVVLQPDARASYRRIVERIAGTFAGVFAAWMITMGSKSEAVVCAAILVVAPLIPHHLANRYWLHTALIALMVLLAYDLSELHSQGIENSFGRKLRRANRLRHSARGNCGCVSTRGGCSN